MSRSALACSQLAAGIARQRQLIELELQSLSLFLHEAAQHYNSGDRQSALALLSKAADQEAQTLDDTKLTTEFARALGLTAAWHRYEEQRDLEGIKDGPRY